MMKTLKKYRAPYLFILPFFILFFVFKLITTIWTVYISFTAVSYTQLTQPTIRLV